MNDDVRMLIRAVAEDNTKQAKQIINVIISKDTTQKNSNFRKSIKNLLQNSRKNLIELPYDMRGLIVMTDPSISFNEERYYLSNREARIYEEIASMYDTSLKLKEMGIRYLNSLLLYGESGTGKTTFGEYIAYKLGLPFAYVRFSNLIDSHLGATSKNVQKVFEFINKNKCVLMIDEIDAIGLERGSESIGEMARIVIGLMQELDNISNEALILGATNRADVIDKALLRRFTIKHEVKKFNEEEKQLMIKKFLTDVGIEFESDNIKEYCSKNESQAIIMNEVIRAIAKSIRNQEKFIL